MKFLFCLLLAAPLFLTSSCCDCDYNPIWIIDPPEAVGPDSSLGYLPLTAQTRATLPVFTKDSRLVFVDSVGTERVFKMNILTESTYHTNHIILYSNAGGSRYAYYDAQTIRYFFTAGDGVDEPFINYVLRVWTYGDQLYDEIFMQAHWNTTHYGQADFVTDDRGSTLDSYVRDLRSNEHPLAHVDLLGRGFDDVIFVSRPEDDTRGFYFKKGVGVVAYQLQGNVLWVLDRVE